MAKEALKKIDEKKRDRIFRNAAAEFARHGFHKANINSIAQRAGIGKGSVYLYFKDKRDLYLSTFKEGVRNQDTIFDGIEEMNLDPMAKIEMVFLKSVEAFPRYRNMYKMYFDLTASGNERSLGNLAQLLERRSAQFFMDVLTEGKASGVMQKNLDIEHTAYLLDSVYTIFLATMTCQYHKERFQVFTDMDISNEKAIKKHVRKTMEFIEDAVMIKRKNGKASGKRSSKMIRK